MGNEKPIAAAPKFQLYNSETGELLGRTAGSWAKISLFYVAYFAFLAGLFTASIQIMKTSIDPDVPKLQTRLNIPGLHFFPKINPDNTTQTDRLKANEQIAFFWDSTEFPDDYFYPDIVRMELNDYSEKAKKVTGNLVAGKNQGVKNFDTKTLTDANEDDACSTYPYGWDSSEPCIYFRLNRIIGWKPVGLFSPEEGTIFAKDGPKVNMQKDAVYVRCEAKKLGTDDGNADEVGFNYYGNKDGAIAPDFFPYEGKSKQPDYQSPMVGVKITGMEDGSKYRVKCQAFARNIVIEERDNLGSIKFEIQHKGEASKTE